MKVTKQLTLLQYEVIMNKTSKIYITGHRGLVGSAIVKNHLSYMLGKTMIATFKKPFGTLRLPFALANTHKAYKQKKAKV